MDNHEVRKVLCIPVNRPLIAIVVDEHILMNVQIVLPPKHLHYDGGRWGHQCVLQLLIVPITADVAAVNCFWCWTGEVAWQACNLVLGEL